MLTPDFHREARTIMNYPSQDQEEQIQQALYDMFHLGIAIMVMREMKDYDGPTGEENQND